MVNSKRTLDNIWKFLYIKFGRYLQFEDGKYRYDLFIIYLHDIDNKLCEDSSHSNKDLEQLLATINNESNCIWGRNNLDLQFEAAKIGFNWWNRRKLFKQYTNNKIWYFKIPFKYIQVDQISKSSTIEKNDTCYYFERNEIFFTRM